MIVIAGLSLKNLNPRVWDPRSEHYLSDLGAIMVSYAGFHTMRKARNEAMEKGLHEFLGAPRSTSVYLDNGAFYFLKRKGEIPVDEYNEFVSNAQPDWYPVPREYIPSPSMCRTTHLRYYEKTMEANLAYQEDGYVPVIHVGRALHKYLDSVKASEQLMAKSAFAIGGIVPNLLRAPKAVSYDQVLKGLWKVRRELTEKKLHVFGMGGTATIHLAALMGFDSVDSSGWRNRAARGIVQLPGTGDRIIAELGNWRGRRVDNREEAILTRCKCPTCVKCGTEGLKRSGSLGFCNRATHNLWVLLKEARWVEERLEKGNYEQYYRRRLDNTVYLPLIESTLLDQNAK